MVRLVEARFMVAQEVVQEVVLILVILQGTVALVELTDLIRLVAVAQAAR